MRKERFRLHKLLRDNYDEQLLQKIITENCHRKLLPKIITENYYQKLLPKIMSENYQLVYQSRRKVEIYRDTGVSKKLNLSQQIKESDVSNTNISIWKKRSKYKKFLIDFIL